MVWWSCLYKIYDGSPAQKAELKKVASTIIGNTLIFPIFNGKEFGDGNSVVMVVYSIETVVLSLYNLWW